MQVTAGIHIDKSGKSYSNVVYHNERKKRIFNDKNKHINWNLTKYNQVGKLNDADKLLETNAKSYVNQYNARQKKQGHKKRCFSSVNQYIQKRGKKAKRRGIIWLGKSEFRTKFENQAIKRLKKNNPKWSNKELKKYLRTDFEPKILKRELVEFNKRHQHIKICRYAIHVDEGFIHAHVELVALPSYTNTKTPRPSFSMSKAVREEFPTAKHEYHTKTKYYGKYKRKKKIIHGDFIQNDGRKALHLLDDEEGKALTHIAHDMSIHVGVNNLSLTRTGNASSLSGAKYKHYAIYSDKADSESSVASTMTSKANEATASANASNTLNNSLSADNKSLKAKNKKIQSRNKDLANQGYNDGYAAGLDSASASINDEKISLSASASSSASTAVSKANSAIAQEENSINLKEQRFLQFQHMLYKQFQNLLPDAKNIDFSHPNVLATLKTANPKFINKLIDGSQTAYFDGKHRSGIDLITHLASYDIMTKQRQNAVQKTYNEYNNNPSDDDPEV